MKKVISLLILLFPAVSFAGSQTGVITKVLVRASDGLHYFYMTGTPVNKPACAVSPGNYWMIRNENSVAGRSQLAILLAAQVSGKTVVVWGTDTCTRWSDGEDVNTIHMVSN